MNDIKTLQEAYQLILESGNKALTPQQIAKKAKPAGSTKVEVNKSPEEDKKTTKILKAVPYTDQNPENFNQDGEDTAVEDRYVVKEGHADIENLASDVLQLDAESLQYLFEQIKNQFDNHRDVITNMDIDSVITHLDGIINIFKSRTGE